MTVIRSQLLGTGYKLPAKVLTNDDLSKMVDTNDEWIMTRIGVKERRILNEFAAAILPLPVKQPVICLMMLL